MQFPSHLFILIFLPFAALGFRFLRQRGRTARPACAFLLVCSLWFYLANDARGFLILLCSLLFNYLLGKKLRQTGKSSLLTLGIVGDLALLALLKYTNFAVGSLFSVFGADFAPLHLIVPLGLSFFTFQQISWLCESAEGVLPPSDPLAYALYILFFPTIQSGPIALPSEMLPQFAAVPTRDVWQDAARGLVRISFGLAKKVLIADVLAGAVACGFASAGSLPAPSALLVMLDYTLQLYFDFSGYCDIAAGAALLLGFELPVNFLAPYRALSVSDFWKRWHMTLTRFLTRRLYIPLGGSRRGLRRTCINVMIVFLLSGLWHGANWTFLIWGGLHGCAMVAERLWRRRPHRTLPRPAAWLLTFLFVNICWVFFRADTASQAFALLGDLIAGGFGPMPVALTGTYLTAEMKVLNQLIGLDSIRLGILSSVLLTGGALALATLPRRTLLQYTDENCKPSVPLLLGASLALAWSILSFTGVGSFLYFTF